MPANNKIEKKPASEEISARAYQLWEQSRYVTGQDLKFWLQAEKELLEPGASAKPARKQAR